VTDDLSQDPTLIQDFVTESEELLQGMDQDMVALESNQRDGEALNRTFRALHTIKGTASFLGLEPIARLSHAAEDVLSAIRGGEVQIDHAIMESLLASRDQLGIMLKDLREGSLRHYEIAGLLAELEERQHPRAVPQLGELLVKDAVITAEHLDALLAEQAASAEPRKLGELLVERGLSSPAQIGEALARQKKIAQDNPAHTLRVDVRKLDDLINLVGELVLERNRLSQLSRECSSGNLHSAELEPGLARFAARLSFITDELQSAALRTRMVPMESVFRKFPRVVRDLARDLQKEVQLQVRGEGTEIDKSMVEMVSDPLLHLVRNALDHGIELPAVREKSGKSRQGTIRLQAQQEGDRIVVTVSDDGAGIDPERVGRKAVEKGLVAADRLRLLSAREILDFIFLPGFSTAEQATNLSGRGVGLDVVRTNMKKLDGTIELESCPGTGTEVRLNLPLTLAIVPVLLVGVGKETYEVPLRSVLEAVRVESNRLHRVEGREFLSLHGATLPLLRLQHTLHAPPANGRSGIDSDRIIAPEEKVVIVAIAEKRIALLVDQLLGQETTVVKPLGKCLHGCASFAGASIGGDGRVRLVLDPAGLAAALQSAGSTSPEASS
jgi:two-component system chemotaxis sensor kinase CheA